MNLLPPRHLYGRRQANENENSWSRYINEETNAKINSSYNYLEVEILSEKNTERSDRIVFKLYLKNKSFPIPVH